MSFVDQPAARASSISYINDNYLADEQEIVRSLAAEADRANRLARRSRKLQRSSSARYARTPRTTAALKHSSSSTTCLRTRAYC